MSTPVTELEIVICSPSRIQAAPSPATIRVWNGDQLRRSSRAGMVLRILTAASAVLIWDSLRARSGRLRLGDPRSVLLQQLGDDDPGGRFHQREMRERLREVPQVPARVGVELLGVEAERRGDAQQLLH